MLSCVACGNWHQISPTGMAIIIHAYSTGMMQTVGRGGILSVCMRRAFEDETVLADFRRRYAKNSIRIDGIDFTSATLPSNDAVYAATIEEESRNIGADAISRALKELRERQHE